MKTIQSFTFFLVVLIYIMILFPKNKIDINLPEEYKAMKNDTIIGNYDSVNNVLYIKFTGKHK